ncbi:MAG: electron transport complex subunit RsxC [Clostridia bacterium]|nr:electron transport complex subunit RsxC [Clostridia bacterium]
MLHTFKRGIHPHDGKELSRDEPIRDILPGETLIYPMSQHIGAPAVPCVNIGDHVLIGTKIAEPGSFVSCPIHSSVSGEVVSIGPAMTLKGEPETCITIKNDNAYEVLPSGVEGRDVSSMDSASILAAIRDAGIVGLGGAGFPMHVKLGVKDPTTIDYLIVNGSECEPYLTSDYRLMLEESDKLMRGVSYLLRLFPKAKALIGIENNKPDCIEKLSGMVGEGIEVCPLLAKYPQGGERMLIYALTGRKLNVSMLPAQVGCVVVNVASVIAATEALEDGRPLTRKVMTITGDGVNQPSNVRAYIGDSYRHVLEESGGFKGTPGKVISGGPMMGISMFTLDIPVVKTSASILAFGKDPVAQKDMSPCIRCGACMRACPEGLIPQHLALLSDRNKFEEFEKCGGMECIECGCCAFVCPAKRPLVQSMRYGRRETGALQRARKAAAAEKGGKS